MPTLLAPSTPPAILDERRVLNLGAGERHRPDAVNVDLVDSTGPDVVHDLNRLPWPFPDDRFREVLAFDVIEHLDDVIRTMEEIHRVCEDGAIVRITVPHFSCSNAFTDPTHRHYFGCSSFHYVTGEHRFSFYTDRRFRRVHSRIVFVPTLLNRVVHRLANRFPDAYERRWAWIFPAWFLYFELQVVKDPSAAVAGE